MECVMWISFVAAEHARYVVLYVKGCDQVTSAGSVVHVDIHGEWLCTGTVILQMWQIWLVYMYMEGCGMKIVGLSIQKDAK